MSQNPAHTPRRALSPPAVTRFQLRTASASEAVFSPPYVPGRPRSTTPSPTPADSPDFLTPAPPPIALPRPTRPLELPRPPASTSAIQLPPRPPDTARTKAERTEPGSWREIIARFESELGDVVEHEEAETPPGDEDTEAGPEPTGTPGPPEVPDDVAPADAAPDAGTVGPAGLEPSLSWEFEAMTTPDYVPHRPIHDPAREDWPVDAEDGSAVEPWTPDEPTEPAPGETADTDELLLDDVALVDPWDIEAEPDDDAAAEFPLDAFIVPAGTRHVPSGYDTDDVAQRVALRLDALAEELRAGGLNALGATGTADELSRVLAAIVTGYVARDG
jgi:hypothetical protein